MQGKTAKDFCRYIRQIVIQRTRYCACLAILLQLVYLIFELVLFQDDFSYFLSVKIALMTLFVLCLPLTFSHTFQSNPLTYIFAFFILYLGVKSTFFIASDFNSIYFSSYIIDLLFLIILIPYHHRKALILSGLVLMAFNVSFLFNSEIHIDRLLFQNFILCLVSVLVFIKGFFENRLLFQQFYLQRHLEKTRKELQISLKGLKQTQMKLIQSEKMASLGRLVAGLTHELNNPINYLYGNIWPLERYINYLEDIVGNPSPPFFQHKKSPQEVFQDLKDLVATLKDGVLRMKDITQDLSTFSKGEHGINFDLNLLEKTAPNKLEAVDVHEGLEKSINLVKYMCKDRILIHRDYQNIPKAKAISVHLNQVFLNLLTNAIQAQKTSGGEIAIVTRFITGQELIHVSFQDRGRGIKPENLDHIFEPFFTTKRQGEGGGLGLSITHSLLKAMGGEIHVRSEWGVGSTFSLLIPAMQNIMEDTPQLKGVAA